MTVTHDNPFTVIRPHPIELAVELTGSFAALPEITLRSELVAAREAFDRPLDTSLLRELHLGIAAIEAGGPTEGVGAVPGGRGPRWDAPGIR